MSRPASARGDWTWRLHDAGLRRAVHAALDRAIEDLAPHDRAVVVLCDGEGVPLTEVAKALGLTVAEARIGLDRARQALRARLTETLAAA